MGCRYETYESHQGVSEVNEGEAMENLVYRAHFDGTQICLDEPVELAPDTKLLVTILQDDDPSAWHNLSALGIAAAYSDDEPEYALTAIKEFNPAYERG